MLLKRPIRTRFRYGSPTRVNLATQRKLAGSFFKRHAVTPTPTSGQPGSDGLEAHGFRYYFTPRQGYFSPFPHGTCPLSVIKEYLGLTGGPARFTRNFRGSVLLGMQLQRCLLTLTGLSPSTAPLSNGLQLHKALSYSASSRQTGPSAPTTPRLQPLPGITQPRFGLIRFRSPLLSESLLFSLPVGTEMFHFPTFPPHTLYIQVQVTGHDSSWVSPFGHPRITARLPTPQGLSQAPTSFIGS